ncbi:unnamed protein product [Mytilus edulis]|uniref:Uncharacterized protein n=1 Tax=Mytilus edulis TaxID=6550 RepID=A0A8S3TM81_MYTED|nr:unnamed protein product [Mytilus edulis]
MALQATRPIQIQAPARAAPQPVQINAKVRLYHAAVATPQPSLQSRLGPPVCVGAASVRRLATPVSPAVPPTFVNVPAATVGLAANQVMPLESSTPMDDLYDFFMPDVTMTAVADQSTTKSSAISNYRPIETPSSSSPSVPPTGITSANPTDHCTYRHCQDQTRNTFVHYRCKDAFKAGTLEEIDITVDGGKWCDLKAAKTKNDRSPSLQVLIPHVVMEGKNGKTEDTEHGHLTSKPLTKGQQYVKSGSVSEVMDNERNHHYCIKAKVAASMRNEERKVQVTLSCLSGAVRDANCT